MRQSVENQLSTDQFLTKQPCSQNSTAAGGKKKFDHYNFKKIIIKCSSFFYPQAVEFQ